MTKPISPLRQRMIDDMTMRNLSPSSTGAELQNRQIEAALPLIRMRTLCRTSSVPPKLQRAPTIGTSCSTIPAWAPSAVLI